MFMTQLAYIPAFEYSRCVLKLGGGTIWQLPNQPETRVRQGRQFGSIVGKEIFPASSPGIDVLWVRVLSAWDSRNPEELLNADQ